MEFWKWYLGGLAKIPGLFIAKIPGLITSGYGQYLWGVVLGVASSAILATVASPYWLLLTLPTAATVCAHGIWREKR